jgi:hypothetical protein
MEQLIEGVSILITVSGAFAAGYITGRRKGFQAASRLNALLLEKLNAVDDPLEAGDVVRAISGANSTRHHGNLIRRIVKLMEELGEASEAYLNVTSAANGKNLAWADVREELVDCVIVAVDCALTPTPDQENMTTEQVEAEFTSTVSHKLAKWKRNRDTGKAATDAE